MSNQLSRDSNLVHYSKVRTLYPEFLSLLARRRDEILGLPRPARWDLSRVGANPDLNFERVMKFLDSDCLDARSRHCSNQDNLGSRQEKLTEVREAIDRMRNGLFGLCKSCLKEIAIDDLRAFPEVAYCTQCQHPLS